MIVKVRLVTNEPNRFVPPHLLHKHAVLLLNNTDVQVKLTQPVKDAVHPGIDGSFITLELNHNVSNFDILHVNPDIALQVREIVPPLE